MNRHVLCLPLAFIGVSAAAQIGPASFGPAVMAPAGDSPVQCALVDLQSDGKPDLVVANYLGSTISFYRNQSASGSVTPSSFSPPTHLASGPGPHAMVVGDVDGDGRQDVVTANLGNNTISIFRNTSASSLISFEARVDISIPGQLVRNAAIGDLDGDGRNDIAVVAMNSDNLILLRNVGGPGSLSFDPPFVMPNIGDGPHSVMMADIDGDTRLDLVVGNFETPDLVVIRRALHLNPARPFSASDFAPPARFPRGGNALDVADMDGDGRVDIAVGNWRTHGMALYRNISPVGAIVLESPVEFDLGNSIHGIVISDLDADSRPELVMVGELASYMSIYRNESTPGSLSSTSFAARVEYPSGWNAIGVTVGDIQGDGRPDILFANAYDDNLSIYQNRIGAPLPPLIVQQPQSQTVETGGTAVFNVGVTGTPPFGFRWRRNGLTIVPFGQGTDTLVISNAQTSHAGFYDVIITNAGNISPGVISERVTLTVLNGTNVPPTITRHPESQTVNAGTDVTFTVEATGTEPLSYRWRRNGTILPGATNPILTLPSVTTSNSGFYSAIVSNIAGVRASSTAELRVTGPTNPPSGPPMIASFTPPSGPAGTVVTITGMNFSPNPIANRVYFGAMRARVLGGSGNSLAAEAPLGATYEPISVITSNRVAYSDRPFVVTFNSSHVINTGSFAAALNYPAGDGPGHPALGDIDRDGRLDLVVPNYFQNNIGVYLNQATNVTLDSPSITSPVHFPTAPFPFAVTLADLDADGRLDVITPNVEHHTISLLRNLSVGTNVVFAPPINLPVGQRPAAVAVGDLNKDGRLDIVVANLESDSLSIFRNLGSPFASTGSNSFSPRVDIAIGDGPHAVVIGDVDGDGGQDIIVANYPGRTTAIFRNVDPTAGVLAPAVHFPRGGNFLAFGDLDGDGKNDIAVVNYDTQILSIFHNVASPGAITPGSLAAPLDLATGSKVVSVAFSDLDGDARPDVAVAGEAPSYVSIFQNVSSPGTLDTSSFSSRLDFPTGSNPRVAIGDLDRDSRPDIVCPNFYDDNLNVFHNRITEGTSPPVITRQPESRNVSAGADVSFSVEVTGTQPFLYSWHRNGLSLPGATNPVLTLSSVTTNDNGFYSVVVSNVAGFAISSSAELRVVGPTNPPPGTVRLVNAASTWRYEQSGNDLGISWTAPNYNDGAWPSGAGLLGVETGQLPEPINTPLALGPTTYYFRHAFSAPAEHLTAQSVFRARLIVDDGAVVYVNGVEALRLGMPPGPITFNTLASRTIPDAIVYEGPFIIPAGLFNVGVNTIAVEVHQSATVSSDVVFGMTLEVEPGSGDPVAPTITRQPSNQTVPLGGTASFSVEATGTPPLSYQWHRDTSIIPGATNRTFVISNVSSNEVGFYSVLVGNPVGSIMSTQALLRISGFPTASPPMITSFTPHSGPTGTVVTITGMNFSPNPIANRVYFGAMRARVLGGSSNTLTAEVPVGATYEPISIITSNRVAYSDRRFVVTFPSSLAIHSRSFSGFNLPAGDLPVHVAMGDMDRDGRLDFVAVNHYSGTASVYLNRSTNGVLDLSSFGPPRIYPTGPLPFHLALADMDGDGGLDVITANMGDHTISLLRSTPAGVFALGAPLHFPVGQLPDALATGDLDKDGRTDIVIANQNSDSITILRQISNPFSPLTVVPFSRTDLLVGDGPHNLIVGDVDGDGRPDITVANYLTPTMAVLRNLTTAPGINSGSFAPPIQFPRGGTCLAFGDLDGDGKQDLAVGNWRTQTLSIFHNISTPGAITLDSLAAPVDFPMGNNPHTIAFSDLDGDALLDIAVVGELDSYMSIFKNVSSQGLFSFDPRVDFPSGWNAIGIAAGDLDGDSRPELVFANAYDDNLTVYRNLTIVEPNRPPEAHANAHPGVDFLSDGPFIVFIAPSTEVLVVFDGSGSRDADGDVLSYQWSMDGAVFATGAVTSNLLAIGEYEVTLTVSDGFESDSEAITVRVIDPASAVQALIAMVEESNLPRRSKRPIIVSLKTAAAALAENRNSAVQQLQLAKAKIEHQIAPHDPALAALLSAALQEIIDAVSPGP